MKTVQISLLLQKITFTLVVLLIAAVADPAALSFLIFAGPCGSGECGSSGCSGGGGDGGGDSGDSGTCGTSCTGTSSSNACSSGADGGSTSTPYLFLKDNRGAFKAINDVMIGTPCTLRATKKLGEQAFIDGKIGSDTYLIPSVIAESDGSVQMEIRELEPEESYINSVTLHRYEKTGSQKLVTDHKHQLVYSYYEHKIKTHSFSAALNNKKLETAKLQGENRELVPMGVGARMSIDAKLASASDKIFLKVGSLQRDWTAGEFHRDTTLVKSPFFSRISKSVTMVGVGMYAFLFGGGGSYTQQNNLIDHSNEEVSKLNFLAESYSSVPHVHADTVHNSLLVKFFDPIAGMYIHTATIQPRAHTASEVMIELPKEAVLKNGNVKLEIMATKRHIVESIELLSGDITEAECAEVLTQKQVLSTDHAGKKSIVDFAAGDESFVHLKPSEKISLEFAGRSHEVRGNSVYALKIAGFYTPLSSKTKLEVGDWMARLSDEDRKLMHGKYPLRGYYEPA